MIKRVLIGLYMLGLLSMAADSEAPIADSQWSFAKWSLACTDSELQVYNPSSNRYFSVGGSNDYPLILADTKTISIDRKKKLIKVWTTWLASDSGRQSYINQLGNNYSDYGVMKKLGIIDYGNMRSSIISYVDYSCSGNTIFIRDYKSEFTNIIPDSVMEGITQEIMKKYNLKQK